MTIVTIVAFKRIAIAITITCTGMVAWGGFIVMPAQAENLSLFKHPWTSMFTNSRKDKDTVSVCTGRGCAGTGTEMSLDELLNLSAHVTSTAAILPARANLLSDVAMLLGSHKGIADRSAQWIAALEARSNQLDKLYRFSVLVTQQGVLLPVITEAHNAIHTTDKQMRRADRLYRMVAPARFVTTPPSWRNYLFVGLTIKPRDARPSAAALPKTPVERAYWKQQVRYGYQHGLKLADEIFNSNRARLERDYLGMLRYAELLHKGMVSEPTVSVAQTIVTGDQEQMNIGDTLYRMTHYGGFITDAQQWQPTIIPAVPTVPTGLRNRHIQ